MNLLKLLLHKRLSRLAQISRGFTLVELLVSIVIASIVVGTLLSFMTNILTSERREQAKATTELEIQSAIDYIADDLQEAVYIYNADGIAAIKNHWTILRKKSAFPKYENRHFICSSWIGKLIFNRSNSVCIININSFL